MTLDLRRVAVVLVSPKHEGNVGAAARAMANMGAAKLVLVAPRCGIGDEARARACEGDRILDKAKIVDSFTEAAGKFHTLVGTSARVSHRRRPILTPRSLAPNLAALPPRARVALIFGPEESGLDNDTLSLCHYVVRIPAVQRSSLNLAHAVCLMLYDLRCWALEQEAPPQPSPNLRPASNAEVEAMLEHFAEAGRAIDYLRPHSEEHVLWKFRRLFNRAVMTREEVRLLRGLCRRMIHAAGAKKTKK